MDIRIQRALTGQQLRDSILRKYGDEKGVAKAAKAGDVDAKDAQFNLRLFKEDPRRLQLAMTIEDIFTLEANDLSRLTLTRLHILEVLRELGEASVKELTKALKRDPKNVSEDVACLMEYGLVTGHRQGKEKLLQVSGNQIVIAV